MIDFGQVVTKDELDEKGKAKVKKTIADRRYQEETKGITVNGMTVNTERDSQSMITGATLSAMLDKTYTCRWKTAEGFVELNATELLAVSQEMRKHVQDCFDREAELSVAVDNGTFKESMLDEGWPA